MHFVRQIFLDKVEDWVHDRFVKYGMGEFNGPVLNAKVVGGGVRLSGTADYATAIGELIAKNSRGDVSVKGTVIARRDVEGMLNSLSVGKSTKKLGLFTVEVSGSVGAEKLLELYGQMPDAYFLLDIDSDAGKLKCKKKLPKPGSGADDKFLSASIDVKAFGPVRDELFFDIQSEFKDATVMHRYVISDIVAPEGVTDPAKIRVMAKRRGRVTRTVDVDGQEIEGEKDFLV